MAHAVTIGLDIAKSVFQVHGVDAAGEVVTCPTASAPTVIGVGLRTSAHRFAIRPCAPDPAPRRLGAKSRSAYECRFA